MAKESVVLQVNIINTIGADLGYHKMLEYNVTLLILWNCQLAVKKTETTPPVSPHLSVSPSRETLPLQLPSPLRYRGSFPPWQIASGHMEWLPVQTLCPCHQRSPRLRTRTPSVLLMAQMQPSNYETCSINLAIMNAWKLFYSYLYVPQQYIAVLTNVLIVPQVLWIKASAKCPKCKCKWKCELLALLLEKPVFPFSWFP